MNNVFNTLGADLSGVVFIVIAFVFVFGARLVNAVGYNRNHAIEEDGNLAVGLRETGFYLAIVLGMYGTVDGASQGFWNDIVDLLLSGFIITVLMFVARWINDIFIVPHVDNSEAIYGGNVAVGIVECGGYIATGIIAWASFSGSDGGLLSGVIYFLVGQFVLVGVTRLYEYLVRWNIVRAVAQGNQAAGIMLASLMLAASIALFGSIAGESVGLVEDVVSFVLHAVIAIVLLMVTSPIVDFLFFFNRTKLRLEIERDKNTAAAAMIGATKIAVALMINAAVV